MDQSRLLELAVEELERQKTRIVAEIEIVQSELEGIGNRAASKAKSTGASTGRTRPKTQAERKAQSQRMKKYWAAKRARKEKSSSVVTTPPTSAKARTKTAAEKRAL